MPREESNKVNEARYLATEVMSAVKDEFIDTSHIRTAEGRVPMPERVLAGNELIDAVDALTEAVAFSVNGIHGTERQALKISSVTEAKAELKALLERTVEEAKESRANGGYDHYPTHELPELADLDSVDMDALVEKIAKTSKSKITEAKTRGRGEGRE